MTEPEAEKPTAPEMKRRISRRQYSRDVPVYRSHAFCAHNGPRFRLVDGEEACLLCVHVVERKSGSAER